LQVYFKSNLGDGISIIKIDVDKTRNSIQVSGARCSLILFSRRKQLWRESGVLDKNAIIKVILDKVINDKIALVLEQAY
jgi:thioredoxin 1